MRIIMRKRFIFLFFALGVLVLAANARAQSIVIANPSVKASDVSKGDLRDVFTGSSTSLGGSQVTPVLLKSGATHDDFLRAYVGKNDTAFRAGWRSLVFSGQASMPKSVDSDAAMVEYVAHTPGAIGYVSSGAPHEGVKVLGVK
jgi:ABC-type phosphate transport system substrate-binding protein